jgi:hypothetical protein
MFAINHAATALIFKRHFENVSLVALLLSVQVMEFAWVVLNYRPEDAMAGHPLTLVSVILLQIVVTMLAVLWAARKVSHPERPSGLVS